MRTLRSRLLLGTALGAIAVLLISGGLLYTLIAGALRTEFDDSLAAKANALAAMTEQDGDVLELDFDEFDLPEFRPSPRAEVYQVWRSDGQVVSRSPSLQGGDLPLPGTPADQPAYASVKFPDGRRGRMIAIPFTPRVEDEEEHEAAEPLRLTLAFGRDTAGLDATLAQIQLGMIAVGAAAVLVSLGVLAVFVRRGLKPVEHLAAEIDRVGETDLATRIDAKGIPLELVPVVDRLNDLLRRLESAFDRERRFTADVAHELRTPLAGVRSTLEVTLSKKRQAEDYQKAMTDCLTMNQQMNQLVENLLSLARADAGQLAVAKEPVDLENLLKECWRPFAGPAQQRGIAVDARLQSPCKVVADPEKLRLVLRNVLGNAATHADDRGRITIRSVSNNGNVELTVANTGSQIAPTQVKHVFERFWRGDASRRSNGRSHSGLGLALCKTLVDLIGGSIQARSTDGGEFTIVLTMNGAEGEKETQNVARVVSIPAHAGAGREGSPIPPPREAKTAK